MTQPAELDLYLTQGDAETLDLAIDSPDGTDLDLTGYTDASWNVKGAWPDAAALVSHSVAGDGAVAFVTPRTTGRVLVSIAADDFDAVTIPAKGDRVQLAWDLKITDASGGKSTVARGALYLLASAAS